MNTTDYLTTAKAAKRLGVDPSRIRHWYAEGKLPRSTTFGRDLAIHPDDVEAMRSRPGRGRPKKNPENSHDTA